MDVSDFQEIDEAKTKHIERHNAECAEGPKNATIQSLDKRLLSSLPGLQNSITSVSCVKL